ncbi:ClbS/DfsB family four-helix bundle protein [Winogradskyella jejuensis]|uniref:DinB superfamily protein n=1 Tax=Winogradskyella jejuensis TaxID=1089305 RepID=A0A1M5US31_9FLAO|nr:ClbS/DfsB family four-helix bundle protein [Winogradskyella jejuensis]SHH65726.1 hypothetical protein SAMN05444148_2580 [Winogradskyella jejuensis]
MPRPKSKSELIELSQENFKKLMTYINDLSTDLQHQEFPAGTMNRNIRDVLAHLHHWHTMILQWYDVGMKGEKPDMPAKGYTWKTTPELNRWIFNHYDATTLDEAKSLLFESYQQVQKIISKHSNEELFEKKRYKWTGSTSMGSYFVSATSSHYDWALKLIKKAFK